MAGYAAGLSAGLAGPGLDADPAMIGPETGDALMGNYARFLAPNRTLNTPPSGTGYRLAVAGGNMTPEEGGILQSIVDIFNSGGQRGFREGGG